MHDCAEHSLALMEHKDRVAGAFNDLAAETAKLPVSMARAFLCDQIWRMATLIEAQPSGVKELANSMMVSPQEGTADLAKVLKAFHTLETAATTSGQYTFPIAEDHQREMFLRSLADARIYFKLALHARPA